VGSRLLSPEKDRIEFIPLTVGDIVTKIREVSERLAEDNVSQIMTRLGSKLDEFADLASSDPWRSELAFISVMVGMSGATLGRLFKDSSVTTKKEATESAKSILLRLSQHVATKDWNQAHTDLRDLYSVVHRVEGII